MAVQQLWKLISARHVAIGVK